jgi:hypothetical protein
MPTSQNRDMGHPATARATATAKTIGISFQWIGFSVLPFFGFYEELGVCFAAAGS